MYGNLSKEWQLSAILNQNYKKQTLYKGQSPPRKINFSPKGEAKLHNSTNFQDGDINKNVLNAHRKNVIQYKSEIITIKTYNYYEKKAQRQGIDYF